MTEPVSVREDLQFIRRAVERTAPPDVAGIYFLWALLVGLGLILADLAPGAAPWYWLAAAPLGTVASAALGIRSARHSGYDDRAFGLRHVAHWGVLMLVLGLGAVGVARHVVSGEVFALYALLMVSGAWLMAGIHFERRLLLLGGILAGVFLLQIFQVPRAGLVGGALFAGAALVLGLRAGRVARAAK
ncbi:MAG: hypothetical protein HOP28_02705 [Gemmatimonadales bacterium]|nr:hypothetical protein [Gemmatimonadales bacterium]